MAENRRALLAGAVDEMLSLARRLGWEIAAVVDPQLEGKEWRGLPAFQRDADALAAVNAKAVILAIDDPIVRKGRASRRPPGLELHAVETD